MNAETDARLPRWDRAEIPDFEDRVSRVYRDLTGDEEPGSKKWFADILGVHPKTVQKWMRGVYRPSSAAKDLLEELEENGGDYEPVETPGVRSKEERNDVIRRLREHDVPLSLISRIFGISRSRVWQIEHGRQG